MKRLADFIVASEWRLLTVLLGLTIGIGWGMGQAASHIILKCTEGAP